MLRRTPQAVFGPGATVFPGGAVDASDGAPNERITGLDDLAASGELGLAAGGLARRVAAVRECFEEAGILLAGAVCSRRRGTDRRAPSVARRVERGPRDVGAGARDGRSRRRCSCAARLLALVDAGRRAPPLRHVVLRGAITRRSGRCARRRRAGRFRLAAPDRRAASARTRRPRADPADDALSRGTRRASRRRTRSSPRSIACRVTTSTARSSSRTPEASASSSPATTRRGRDGGRFLSPTSTSAPRPDSRPKECHR